MPSEGLLYQAHSHSLAYSRILVVLVKDLVGSLEVGVGGLDRQKSLQSSGAAERNAAYPTSGTLRARTTGTRTNGRDMHA